MRVILALLLLCSTANAADITLSAGPLVDTTMPLAPGSKARIAAELTISKTCGRLTPYTGIETYFGERNGYGLGNPVAAKWTVGIGYRITDSLHLVLDHYSRHAVDGYAPTEKLTWLRLRHKFTF